MPTVNNYDRASVQRGLDIHYKDRWGLIVEDDQHLPHGVKRLGAKPGAVWVSTGIGILRLRTLREQYAHVVGLAEGKRLARVAHLRLEIVPEDPEPEAPTEPEDEFVAGCPACGAPIDYCQGHGPIGDPFGAAILAYHDQDNHGHCHPDGCDEAKGAD